MHEAAGAGDANDIFEICLQIGLEYVQKMFERGYRIQRVLKEVIGSKEVPKMLCVSSK